MTPLPTRAASGKPRHKQNAFAYELTALISLTKRLGTRFYLPCVSFEKDPKCTCSVDKKVPNACSMRAHEMEPKAQCNWRRRACTGYILNARNSLLCERLQSPFTIPHSLHSEICLSSSSRVSKSISEKYNDLALRRVGTPANIRPPTAAGYVILVYSGRPSNSGTSTIASSQTALLDVKMCAVGNTDISVSKHPAGTTSRSVSWGLGNAEPHDLQKLLLWRVPGRLKEVTASTPASQVSLADCENKFAA